MKKLTSILLSASALCLGQLAHAAPLGTAFTYQGRRNENGQPTAKVFSSFL